MARWRPYVLGLLGLAAITFPFLWLTLAPDFVRNTMRVDWSPAHGLQFFSDLSPVFLIALLIWLLSWTNRRWHWQARIAGVVPVARRDEAARYLKFALMPLALSCAFFASASTLSLKRGQTGTITLTALANASFSGNVSFAVSGGSTGMSISLTPSQVTLTPGQSGTSVLVVSTTAPSSALQWPFAAGGGLSLAGLFLLVIPRRLRRKLSSFAVAILGAVVLAGVLGLMGCGGGSGVKTAPEGSSTLTITATPAGLTAQMVSVTVTVQ